MFHVKPARTRNIPCSLRRPSPSETLRPVWRLHRAGPDDWLRKTILSRDAHQTPKAPVEDSSAITHVSRETRRLSKRPSYALRVERGLMKPALRGLPQHQLRILGGNGHPTENPIQSQPLLLARCVAKTPGNLGAAWTGSLPSPGYQSQQKSGPRQKREPLSVS